MILTVIDRLALGLFNALTLVGPPLVVVGLLSGAL